MGDGGRLVTGAVDSGHQAIVMAAMGAGHVSPEIANRLQDALSEVPVVFCSRSPNGQVRKQTYGYEGGEMDLLQRGLISGGWLSPLKAKVLITLMLMQGCGVETTRNFTVLQEFDGGSS